MFKFIKMKLEQFVIRTISPEFKLIYDLEETVNNLEEENWSMTQRIEELEKLINEQSQIEEG